jgi:16S rRNA (adenine1518-N6/adenine1519-N6)-dimethyltransferase
VLLQASFDAKLLFHVSPGSFFPAPKVTSSVIMLKRKENYILPCNEKVFKAVVKASFNQRRKMLRNSIKALISDENLLNHEYMTRRPEQMSLDDYFELTTIIENQEL